MSTKVHAGTYRVHPPTGGPPPVSAAKLLEMMLPAPPTAPEDVSRRVATAVLDLAHSLVEAGGIGAFTSEVLGDLGADAKDDFVAFALAKGYRLRFSDSHVSCGAIRFTLQVLPPDELARERLARTGGAR